MSGDTEWDAAVTSAQAAVGDVVFAFNANAGATTDPTISDDSGDSVAWTNADGAAVQGTVFYKRITGGNWGSSTVTVNATGNTTTCAGGVIVLRGGQSVDTPYTDMTTEANASGNETHAGITPDFADGMFIGAVYNYVTANDATGQAFGGNAATLCFDCNADIRVEVHRLQQAGGPTASGNFTWSQGNAATVSIIFSFPPDQGGAASTVPAKMHQYRQRRV